MSQFLNLYREIAQTRYGYTASSEQVGWTAPVYIADTDEQAIDEARPHIEALFNKFLFLPFEILFPPGYLTMESYKRVQAHKRALLGGQTIENLMAQGIIIVGSPDTVRKHITKCHHEIGFHNFVTLLQFGTLPPDLTENNIRLFAAEVMPAIQQLTDREYLGFEPAGVAA